MDRQTNHDVSSASIPKWKTYLFQFVTLLAISTIIFGAWITQSIFEKKLRDEKGEVLTAILEQSEDALLDWHRNQKKAALSWAHTYMIRELTASLLTHATEADHLTNTLEQDVMREMLSPLVDANDYQGFFLVSKQKTNLASHSGINPGGRSEIPDHILDEAIAGQVAVSHPLKTTMLLPDQGGTLKEHPTMFIVAPVVNQQDEVIALFALQVDPAKDFTSILAQGRLGRTGDTFAFDKNGLVMSESRFDQQLWDVGLIDTGEPSILNLYLKDPGGNMLTGYRPVLPDAELPLTQMASVAIQGKNGIDLQGYRDYRGVPVIAAWHWNDILDLGIAIEMDLDEAYATLYASRQLVVIATSLTVIVIIALYAVFMVSRARVKKTEAGLLSAQRMAHLGSWDWDIIHNRLDWSDETCRIFGVEQAQFKASYEAFMAMVHPDDREMLNDTVEKSITQKTPYAIEHRIIRPDGAERIVSEQAELECDYTGKILAMRGSVLDITQSKKAEQELLLFKTTSDMVEDSLYMFNPRTLKFFYVNQAAIQQLGYSEEELFEMTPLDIKSEYDEDSFKSLIEPLINGSESTLVFQTTHRRKNGSLLPVDVVLQYLEPKDEEPRFVAVVRDFSERQRIEQELKKEKEKAVEATRSKSEFLANMSHEIRTPMNGVLGMLELMEHTSLEEKQKNYLDTARNSAKSLLTIINDILDFSKIEAGHMHLENIVFNMHETIEDTIAALAKQAESSGLELNCYIPAKVTRYVSGDPMRLRQIITNLVNNAIKFTEHGEVNLRVRHVTDNDSQVCLGFEIKDTGVGIEKDKLDRLFNAFMQADGSITRKYGGTGLGLSICKQLVSMMGGEISVNSKLGKGSTFSFIAFFGRVERQVEKQVIQVPADLRVLVADDNATSRSNITGYLDNWNIQHSETDDVSDLLHLLHDAASSGRPYDVVFLDHFMPEADCEDLVRMIKSDKDVSATHLIMLGTSDGWTCVQLTSSGIESYIIKPPRQSELYNALLHVTGRKQEKVRTDKSDQKKNIHFKDVSVLLVDDVTTNQVVASEMLAEMGVSTVVASNGQDALRKIRKGSFDLVLMDCQMPVMDGYAATEIIRTQEKVQGSARLPIIALTAHAMEGDRDACLAAGMDDYLPKPLTMQHLLRALTHWLPEEMQNDKNVDETVPAFEPVSRNATDEISSTKADDILDAKIIEQLMNLSGERFNGLVDSFEKDVNKAIKGLREAVDSDDADAIVFSAHALKSASMSMAAARMSELGRELEERARKHDITDVSSRLERIEEEKTLVIEALRGLVLN